MNLTARSTALALAAFAAVAAGCTSAPMVAAPAAKAAPVAAATAPTPAMMKTSAAALASTADVAQLFVVLPDTGRIHAFGDTGNYFAFMQHGEVALTRTQIGTGPGGKTLVFGITNDDVKANKPSMGEQILGAATPPAAFYGEVFKGGRFHLFGDLKDMKDYMAFGEIPYSYTQIGAGPKGETLVMVMNKDSYSKGLPTDRLDRFKAVRASAK